MSPQGEPGEPGPPGAQGIQGINGNAGIQGIPGLKGPLGDLGEPGREVNNHILSFKNTGKKSNILFQSRVKLAQTLKNTENMERVIPLKLCVLM